MSKVIGNTTAMPNPRPDWNQTDETKADYIKNKPLIDGFTYAVPSKGLEFEGNVLVGIGTCQDECVVVPDVTPNGTPVTEIAREAFWNNWNNLNDFTKTIVLPPSVSFLNAFSISSTYCINLKSVYITNPNITWDDTDDTYAAIHLGSNVTDVYFAGSRKQWIDINGKHEKPLIALPSANIEAGITPTMHYGYFYAYAGGNQQSEDKNFATEEYVEQKISSLVESAPETLDTLGELAAALNNDENFAATVINQISNKLDKNIITDINLAEVTTMSDPNIEYMIITDKSIASFSNIYTFNVTGNVRLRGHFETTMESSLVINGNIIASNRGDMVGDPSATFEFEGYVENSIIFNSGDGTIVFDEFVTIAETLEKLDNVYTKEETNSLIDAKIGDVDSKFSEKLKNPFYEEQIKLTEVTIAVPEWEGASVYITDNSVSSDGCIYNINIKGDVKFKCNISGGEAYIYVDGKLVAELNTYTENTEYAFEGVINEGMSVHCMMTGVTFAEFVKKVYVSDAIGDMDKALDSILTIQESIVGGVE